MMIKHVQIMLIYLAFFELYYNENRDRLLDTLIYADFGKERLCSLLRRTPLG